MPRAPLRSAVVASILALACACASPPAAPAPADAKAREVDPTPPAGAGHAPAGVRPGSHEDWCAEHQVPESLCTRCNPALIPAFKASHDWCEEHQLPESQCTRCDPARVFVRPPADDEAKP